MQLPAGFCRQTLVRRFDLACAPAPILDGADDGKANECADRSEQPEGEG